MAGNKVMVLGEKETFLIRILVKKCRDAGINCEYVRWNVNDINSGWAGTGLVTVYLDENTKIPDDSLQFLRDKMLDEDIKVCPIGEDWDIRTFCDRVPGDLIYRSFVRPVDHDYFIKTISDFLEKSAAGEFRKTILIVDDDPGFLGLVREWLKDTYKVAMANSGLQAIKWLGKNKADLILLDYEMPVTSGPQVLEMLRNDEETRCIPVMFLTGKGDKESVMSVVALKPEGYFLKTIEKEKLLVKLGEFFKGR